MNTRLQFRILYRQFLFRLMDVELLSGSAQGDSSTLLGQLGALLIFGSLLQAYLALPVGADVRTQAAGAALWPVERFLISLTMLVVGLFALLSWDSTFPDRRDVLVLAPLPVRARTLFAAKIAAAGSALGLTMAAWNSLAGFVWPVALEPSGSGLLGTLRFVAAFWATLLAAGAFLFCVVLGVQAIAAQLPRSWYLRVSPVLQMLLFILFISATLFQPSFNTTAALRAAGNHPILACLPTYWFMGLLSEWSGVFAAEGHAVMAPLARRALAALGIALIVACGAFLLSYLRTMRKIVEEPDIVPGAHGGIRLPRFGSLPQTALARFVIRTVLRSRQHRAILAFYIGGGFAIVVVYLQGALQMMHLRWIDLVQRPNFSVLAASMMMLFAAWLGTRTVFSLPLDLRANWIFRVTPTPSGAVRLAAIRRALLCAAVAPVWAGTGALLARFWSRTAVAEHLLVLGLIGSLLADVSLRGFRKIPFTCSYLPGKTKTHMVFWFCIIPLLALINRAGELEQRAMANLATYFEMVSILCICVFLARRLTDINARESGLDSQFEETASDELIGLGLDR